MTMATAFTECCLFNGCARETPKEAVYQPIPVATRAPGLEIVGSSTNASLAYQWYSTNSNQPTPEFTVTTGGTPTLLYQWYVNTSSNEGQQSTVQAVQGSNGAYYYQWYKNTNSP